MTEDNYIKIGNKAKAFCRANAYNEKRCLKDFAGEWLVLYFYPKDNTPGCTTEACDFTNELSEFNNLNARVVGMSPDSPQSHQKFINKYNLTVNLLSDEDHSVMEKYGVWQLKKNYGKEYMGVVRTTYLINPEGRVSYIWPKVRVKGHVQAVKGKLQELQGS